MPVVVRNSIPCGSQVAADLHLPPLRPASRPSGFYPPKPRRACRRIAAAAIALLFCAANTRASDRVFDVLVVPRAGFAGPVPEITTAHVQASFGDVLIRRVRVLGVARAAPVPGEHTVVLLDFEHASARLHSSMIRETLQALAEVRNPGIRVVAVGESPGNLELFSLAGGSKVGLLLPQPPVGEETQRAENFPRMYWQGWTGVDLIGDVANWFDARDAPVRVIWMTDNFAWALGRPCNGDDPACHSWGPDVRVAMPPFGLLSESGITLFPLVVRGSAAVGRRAAQLNQQGAEYLAKHTGGFPVFAETLGDGRALGPQLTRAGYVVRLSGRVPEPVSWPQTLRISIGTRPRIHFSRDFSIAPAGLIKREIRDSVNPVVPAFHELTADFTCTDTASGKPGLQVTLPETLKSAPPALFYVHVAYRTGRTQEFVFDRRHLILGKPAKCFCAPIDGPPAAVWMVTAYDESANWGAVKVLDDTSGTSPIAPPQAVREKPAGNILPTIRVEVNVVNMLATVRDKYGALIKNLTKEDFTLTEDGRAQQIKYFTRETDLPLTIGMLVDVSGSQFNLIDIERAAADQFFSQVLRKNDVACVIDFDSAVELLQDYTGSARLLHAALGGLHAVLRPEEVPIRGRGTALYDAVNTAATLLKPRGGRKVMVLITDGIDYGSRLTLGDAGKAAQQADTVIYGMYYVDFSRYAPVNGSLYSLELSDSALRKMSAKTGGRVFHVDAKHPLNQAFEDLQQEMRSQYAIGYTPTNGKRDGSFRHVDLRTRGRNLKVQARKGYYAPAPR